jgi:hypothetical protein
LRVPFWETRVQQGFWGFTKKISIHYSRRFPGPRPPATNLFL